MYFITQVVLWRRCPARAQELTSAIVDFDVHNLRPVSGVDSVGFLHLMEVAEPRYTVPCCHTVNSYINQQYLAVKACVQPTNLSISNYQASNN